MGGHGELNLGTSQMVAKGHQELGKWLDHTRGSFAHNISLNTINSLARRDDSSFMDKKPEVHNGEVHTQAHTVGNLEEPRLHRQWTFPLWVLQVLLETQRNSVSNPCSQLSHAVGNNSIWITIKQWDECKTGLWAKYCGNTGLEILPGSCIFMVGREGEWERDKWL